MKTYKTALVLIAFSSVFAGQPAHAKTAKKGCINKVQKNDIAFFDETIKQGGIVVVDFFATWCGPCKRLHSILEKIAKKNQRITFIQIDIEQNRELAQRYKIRSMPTIVIYKDGKIVYNRAGFMNEKELQKLIDSL